MKHFDLEPAVSGEIANLLKMLLDTCKENGVPFVACAVIGNNAEKAKKILSAFIDTEQDLYDNGLISAYEILKIQGDAIPDKLVETLISIGKQEDVRECECPSCQQKRSEKTIH